MNTPLAFRAAKKVFQTAQQVSSGLRHIVSVSPKTHLKALRISGPRGHFDRIESLQRQHLSSLGIELDLPGDFIKEALQLLETLEKGASNGLSGVIEKARVDISNLAALTFEEINIIYNFFTQYVDLNRTDGKITSIASNKRGRLIEMLRVLSLEVSIEGGAEGRDNLAGKIGRFVNKLATAEIFPSNGRLQLIDELTPDNGYWILAHELGHPIYKAQNLEETWPEDIWPLTVYAAKDKQEAFCEDFACYITANPFYRTLALISSQFKRRLAFMRAAYPSPSLRPAPGARAELTANASKRIRDFIYPYLDQRLRDFSPSDKLTDASSLLLALILGFSEKQRRVIVKRMAFSEVLERRLGNFRFLFSLSRKFWRRLIEEGEVEAAYARGLSLRIDGKSLLEYNLAEGVIEFLGLLGEVPEALIPFIKEEGAGLRVATWGAETATALFVLGHTEYHAVSTRQGRAYRYPREMLARNLERMRGVVRDREKIVSLHDEIELAARKAKQNPEETGAGKREIEKKFGIRLEATEERDFSGWELEILSSSLEQLVPSDLKHIKVMRRNGVVTRKLDPYYEYDVAAQTMTLGSDFFAAAHLPSFPRVFFRVMAGSRLMAELKENTPAIKEFLRAGGWRRKIGAYLGNFIFNKNHIFLASYESGREQGFLPGAGDNIFLDFTSLFVYARLYPEVLDKLAAEDPVLARKAAVMREYFM